MGVWGTDDFDIPYNSLKRYGRALRMKRDERYKVRIKMLLLKASAAVIRVVPAKGGKRVREEIGYKRIAS